ncbi:MAG: hypothetical protein AB7F65_08110 [Dehalococcoidia bacterium]
MRYRRLGQTNLMVSELGLEVRAVLGAGAEGAEATLRAAIDGGITLFAWDVSDATEDVEPLVLRAAGVDRGRLTLVAQLDYVPAPEDMGPQVEAIAARLEDGGVEGYVDVIALPGLPDAGQLAALEEVRRRGIARFIAVAGEGDAQLPEPLPAGIDVLVLGGAAGSERSGVGVIARAALGEAPALLEGRAVASVVTSAADTGAVARLLLPVS